MPRLSLMFLGHFQILLDGQQAEGFESNKVRALLAYLAIEADRPHAREALAGLLWPDYPNRSALTNLRSALANLRQVIGDRQADPPFLNITRHTIQFNLASDCALDVSTLRDLPHMPAAQLERAVRTYRGTFLEGFSLVDSPAFEEWVLVIREQIKREVLGALRRLAAHFEAQGEYDLAANYGRRALALEPWDEEAHRQVMRALALDGQRSLALAQFEACRKLLEQELGVEPAQETIALAESIRHEELKSPVVGELAGQPVRQEAPAPGEPPFKGLAFFDEADADIFCGREGLTAELVTKAQQCLAPEPAGNRLLAIIGASGSGKSSIVRAGLVPALRQLTYADGSPSRVFGDAIHVITPGACPLEALALSLARDTAGVAATAALLDVMAQDVRSLHFAAARQAQQSSSPRLLLVVDQFEELFSLCRDEAGRQAFIDNLLYAAKTPGPVVVVLALRADFYARCAPYENLRQALGQRQQYIGAMSAAELRQAMEEPARRGGWTFEPGLVDLLLGEMSAAPGALPLMSHTLLEMWQRRSGRTLTLAGYKAAGGVRGAIARTAETTFTNLSPDEQSMARNIFLRLTEVSEDTAEEDLAPIYTRRRVQLSELEFRPNDAPLAHTVLARLATARLVTVGQETAEVAHEALIQEWGRLRAWLEENRAGLRLHRHLTEAAREWEQMEQDAGGLYRGARLAQALEWADRHAEDLNLLEKRFLEASRREEQAQREAEAEQQRRELQAAQMLAEEQRRRAEAERQHAETQRVAAGKLRRRALSLAGALAASILLLAVAVWLGRLANNNALARQEQARLASSRELAAGAVNALQVDPERSVLLALQAVELADTLEARNALHQALPELHSLHTIAAHQPGGAPGVAYSPDGAWVASIGVDNQVKVWEAATGKLIRTLSGEPGDLGMDVAFSPDGKLLAATFSGQVLVWDAASGELRYRLVGSVAGVVQVDRIAFSPDSKQLAAADIDGQPKVWDLTTGREALTLPGHADHCEAIAFSPNGKQLATGDVGGTVRLWDAESGQVLTTFEHGGNVHGVAFHPGGRQLAAAGEDGRLLVWDTVSGQLVLSLPGRTGLYDVAYFADGQRLVTVHQDGTTVIWEASTGQPLLTLAGHLSTVISVAASPDNVHLATSGFDSTVRLWDTRPGRELLTVSAHAGPAFDIAYSHDGSRLATAGADGKALLWDATTGLLALSLFPETPSPGFSSIIFSPDGGRMAAGGVDGTVLVGDAKTGETILKLAGHTDMVWGLAFSPDGRRLATSSWDRLVKIWDLEEGVEIVTLAGHTDMVFDIAFSLDGQRLFSAGDFAVREWDTTTGEELRSLSGEGLEVFGMALSPDQGRLAMGRQDGTVTVWEVGTGEKLLQLSGHGGLVNGVVFSADGNRLVTGAFDKIAKVWDARTGQELMTLFGQGGNVFGVAISPDGQHVATAGGDGTARLYTLDLDELIELARERVTRSLTEEECRQYLHLEKCPGNHDGTNPPGSG